VQFDYPEDEAALRALQEDILYHKPVLGYFYDPRRLFQLFYGPGSADRHADTRRILAEESAERAAAGYHRYSRSRFPEHVDPRPYADFAHRPPPVPQGHTELSHLWERPMWRYYRPDKRPDPRTQELVEMSRRSTPLFPEVADRFQQRRRHPYPDQIIWDDSYVSPLRLVNIGPGVGIRRTGLTSPSEVGPVRPRIERVVRRSHKDPSRTHRYYRYFTDTVRYLGRAPVDAFDDTVFDAHTGYFRRNFDGQHFMRDAADRAIRARRR
jgi:hypothetical protein